MKGRHFFAAIVAAAMLTGCTTAPTNTPTNSPTDSSTVSASPTTTNNSLAVLNVVPAAESNMNKSDISMDRAQLLVDKANEFSSKLMKSVSTEEENIVFSPLSVYLALACASDCSQGETYGQFETELYPEGMSKDEFNRACEELIVYLTKKTREYKEGDSIYPEDLLEIKIATLLCSDDELSLSQEFANVAKQCFAADVANVDFSNPAAKDEINKWADTQTKGLIKELFSSPISEDTKLILANSLYFSGKWSSPFDKALTEDGKFKGVSGDTSAKFMVQNSKMPYYEDDKFQSVRIQYEGEAYMDVFLPKSGVNLAELTGELAGKNVQYKQGEGLLKMPRFEMDFEMNLVEILKTLGLDGMFTGGLFPAGEEIELFVSDIFQKARIEVDEEGTKAAAVTAVQMDATGIIIPSDKFELILDRPFAYRIVKQVGEREQTLFVGMLNSI